MLKKLAIVLIVFSGVSTSVAKTGEFDFSSTAECKTAMTALIDKAEDVDRSHWADSDYKSYWSSLPYENMVELFRSVREENFSETYRNGLKTNVSCFYAGRSEDESTALWGLIKPVLEDYAYSLRSDDVGYPVEGNFSSEAICPADASGVVDYSDCYLVNFLAR